MVTCRAILSRLDVYLDGELPSNFLLDADCHLALCPLCAARVRFERAFRGWIKDVMKRDAAPSKALERRVLKALIVERTYNVATQVGAAINVVKKNRAKSSLTLRNLALGVGVKRATWSANWGLDSWQLILPIAAIALVALCWAAKGTPDALPAISRSADLSLSQLDNFLDTLMDRHIEKNPHHLSNQPARLSVETSLLPPFALPPMQDVRTLHTLQRTAGSPASSAWPAALVGVSSPYTIKGHRVTFFTYRAQSAPLRARLAGRVIDGQVVYVGMNQGYSIATVEAGPVGFAITSDFSPIQNAKIILSAVAASERRFDRDEFRAEAAASMFPFTEPTVPRSGAPPESVKKRIMKST